MLNVFKGVGMVHLCHCMSSFPLEDKILETKLDANGGWIGWIGVKPQSQQQLEHEDPQETILFLLYHVWTLTGVAGFCPIPTCGH